jgi:TolA-binding protein
MRATVLAIITALLCTIEPAAAQTAAVKDMLGNLWARLRAATPKSAPAAPAVTVTAGLRGEEATQSELKPYWRGDREADPSSKVERQAIESAQALADAGKFGEAARSFDAFLQAHPRSTLAGNALFGAALARAALGERARASAGFEEFLKREPAHPLAEDARQALAALR